MVCKDNTIIIFDKNLRKSLLFDFYENDIKEKENEEEKRYISSLRQIKNGDVLCCYKDLYRFINEDNKLLYKEKIKMPNEDYLFDIIELTKEKILGITNNSIIIINFNSNQNKNKEKDKYEISNIITFPEDWPLKQIANAMRNSYSIQYINLYELPNNKLLIHFNFTKRVFGKAITCPPGVVFDNNIYILNLGNYESINLGTFKGEINILILNKYIVLINSNIISIYDINNYKLLRTLNLKIETSYTIKYDDNTIAGISRNEKKNNIILYNLANLNDINYMIFTGKIMKFGQTINNSYQYIRAKKKIIYKLEDNSILILCNGKFYIVEIPGQLNSFDFKPLNQIEYSNEELAKLKK